MFNVGSDMILELKGGCAIVDRPQCGLHMARGHADLFRFIQDVITKADAAPDFNAAYRTHMDDGRLELFVTQLINAVTFLHQQEIYHLDLKPENVIINERGDFLQLIDFGLAHCDRWLVLEQVGVKKAGDCIGSLSNPNNLYFGSLSYVPDRALACDPGFIRSRDQWALGCMIYVCAYGRMLYVSPTEDRARYDRLMTKRPEEPFSAAYGIPPRFIVENFLGHLISTQPLSLVELCATLWPDEGEETWVRFNRRGDPSYHGQVLAPVPLQRSVRFCGGW